MIQEPYKYIGSHEILSHRLRRLSPREQLAILMRATQRLANREKAEVLGSAGLHFLKSRFFPILLHFLFKRFVKDVLWSTMAVVLALICLLLLAFLEQVNARAVSPIVVAVVAFFLGFLAYEVVHLCRDVYQFLRKTTSKEERELLLRSINALKSVEKVAVLRTIGIELSRRVSGVIFPRFSGVVECGKVSLEKRRSRWPNHNLPLPQSLNMKPCSWPEAAAKRRRKLHENWA